MKLGIENIKQPTSSEDQDVSIEELNARMAESEVDLQETLQEVEQTQRQLAELEEVQGNVEGLKATVENYGVTDALLEVANGGPPSENSEDKGEICRLLNRDDLPQVSEDNQQELSQELTTALEASASDVVQKVKELIKKIGESLKKLVQKVADMVKSVGKKLGTETERLNGLNPDDLSDDVWKQEIDMVEVLAGKKHAEAKPIDESELQPLLENVRDKMEKTRDTIKGVKQASDIAKEDDIWVLNTEDQGNKKLSDIGITDRDSAVNCSTKASEVLAQLEDLEKWYDDLYDDKLQPELEKEEMDEDQAKVIKEAMHTLSNAVKGMAKVSTKLAKTTLAATSQVK